MASAPTECPQQLAYQPPAQVEQNNNNINQSSCPNIIEEKILSANGEETVVKYAKGRFLGKGGFAKCYEFRYAEPTPLQKNKVFAVKVVPKASLTRTKARQKLTSEIKIHKSLSNEFVVLFEKYFEDRENVYIFLEICQNQSLNELVRRRKRMTELEAQCYMLQLIKATEYLHRCKVIHRDLKLGNLFLTDRMQLKVGDFGLATKVLFEGEKKRTICGTPNYIAPEILDAKLGHSYEVDYWSIGVILYTLLVGRPPFESQEVKQTYKKIKANQYQFPETVQLSEPAKDFIRATLKTEPSQRMNLKDMLKHEFMTMNRIPDVLPISTLVCQPSTTFCRQYIPAAIISLNDQVNPFQQTAPIQTQQSPQAKQQQPQQFALQSARNHGNQFVFPQQVQHRGGLCMETQRVSTAAILGNTGSVTPSIGGAGLGFDNGMIMSTRDGATFQQQQIFQTVVAPPSGPIRVEECKTHRDQLARQSTFNSLGATNYMANVGSGGLNSNSQSPIDFLFGKQSNDNFSNRPSTTPFHIDKALYQNHLMAQQSQTPRGYTSSTFDKRLSTNTIAQNNYNTDARTSPQAQNKKQIFGSKVLLNPEKENFQAALATTDDRKETDYFSKDLAGGQNTLKKEQEQVAKIEYTCAAHFPQDKLVFSDNQQAKIELVVQFVDFSSKYGMGYKLSNGSYGVLFNDSTKIVLDPNCFHFDYIQRSAAHSAANAGGSGDDDIQHLDFFNYPKAINKKVILLQHFKSYLDGNSKFKPLDFKFSPENPPKRIGVSNPEETLSYLKKWKRAKKAILFRLSNKIIQIIFQDLSELILCSGNGMVTFVNSKKQVKKLPLSSDLESKDPSMYKRLQYAKEILIQMISKNGHKVSIGTAGQIYQSEMAAFEKTLGSGTFDGNFLEKTQQPEQLVNSIAQNLAKLGDKTNQQQLASHRVTSTKVSQGDHALVNLKHAPSNSEKPLNTERTMKASETNQYIQGRGNLYSAQQYRVAHGSMGSGTTTMQYVRKPAPQQQTAQHHPIHYERTGYGYNYKYQTHATGTGI